MKHGVVKWFHNDKGYGFIIGDDGEEVYVHRTHLRTRPRTLKPEQRVVYDVETTEKGRMAINIKSEYRKE